MTLWIVGKMWSIVEQWEYQGIFDNEQAAIDACEDEDWFIAPVEMNKKVPGRRTPWPGAYYPLAGKVKL